MTANQINYARHKEDVRHNRQTELQKDRDLAIGERQAVASELQASTAARRQLEDARHNQETERVNWFSTLQQTSETQRHNREQEQIQWFTAQAKDRHDTESRAIQSRQAAVAEAGIRAQYEALGIQRLDALNRSRQAVASERQAAVSERQLAINARHATTAERTATVAERNAAVNEYAAKTGRLSAQAAQTSAAAAYQNAIASQQQARVAGVNAVTRQGELAESIRRNSIQLAETQRHNQELEHISSQQVDVSKRQAFAAERQAGAAQQRADNDTARVKLDRANTAANIVGRITGLAASMMN